MNPNAELCIRALEAMRQRLLDENSNSELVQLSHSRAVNVAIQWVCEVAALAEQPAHTDHGRSWDRTCPACVEQPAQAAPVLTDERINQIIEAAWAVASDETAVYGTSDERGDWSPETEWKRYGVGVAYATLIAAIPPGSVVVPVERLEHCLTYWNGNRNDRAMHDALHHIHSEIEDMIAARPGAKS